MGCTLGTMSTQKRLRQPVAGSALYLHSRNNPVFKNTFVIATQGAKDHECGVGIICRIKPLRIRK